MNLKKLALGSGPGKFADMFFGEKPVDTAGVRPDWQESIDLFNEQGQIADPYRLKKQGDVGFDSSLSDIDARLQAAGLDRRALDQLTAEGLDTSGNSKWSQLAKGNQALDERNAMNQAAAASASARSGALSNLASKGGLSSGARERLATSGARDLATSLQGVRAAGQTARGNIDIKGEENRMSQLGSAVGGQAQASGIGLQSAGIYGQNAQAENARKQALGIANRDYSTGVDKANLAATFEEVRRKDEAKQRKYDADMAAYAAAKTADAQTNSGGGKK